MLLRLSLNLASLSQQRILVKCLLLELHLIHSHGHSFEKWCCHLLYILSCRFNFLRLNAHELTLEKPRIFSHLQASEITIFWDHQQFAQCLLPLMSKIIDKLVSCVEVLLTLKQRSCFSSRSNLWQAAKITCRLLSRFCSQVAWKREFHSGRSITKKIIAI